MKIIVLAGGTSSERGVSLSSASCVARALAEKGHEVMVLDPGAGWNRIDPSAAPAEPEQDARRLPEGRSLEALRGCDIVVNVLHGGQGEDGTLGALLELIGTPYVGSPPGACALAMDKVASKRLFESVGVPTPDFIVLDRRDRETWEDLLSQAESRLGLPIVVKPATEGSTVGLTKADTAEALRESVELAARYSRLVLLEKFIPGRELTVGVIGDRTLPVLEVVVPGGFYDFEAKYLSHDNRYICPAEIEDEAAERAGRHALEAFRVLGLEDYARIDFRLDDDGGLWCLEANNQPGMTDSSLLPKAALVNGLDLAALLGHLIEKSLERRSGGGS